ncbi:hypothetical protein Kfla_2476 [Kribbella flavida DSM 17836]|uniref:Uncharacterized protein n=1 Tax=Kribbella flavida (strain DSM 17836 / JCM 10339 / NBRC 14399) TaxID=479435 RepID=D2PW98_KRIFD|nr:hypothetical protein [Kribbella flavida]ADB31550.1 hypothetical protein Kfla_2476 [Kribbella flavida DSM 17836]
MTSAERQRYLLEASPQFALDVKLLQARAKADPARHLHLYREVLRLIEDLRDGVSDGHHALGYEAGKGDLRDCVTAYVAADPQAKANHRLVFRELGPAAPGGLPRRELLAVKPRQGTGNVYEHVCARLGRHPADRQPGLNRFGDRAPGAKASQAQRQAELDTKRAIAHAWAGQMPLASSRPLAPPGTGQRAGPSVPSPSRARTAGAGRAASGPGRPSGTGWPPPRDR